MASEVPLFTVGPPPHWRSGASITRLNYAFILALLPGAVVGALVRSIGAEGLPAAAQGPGIISETIRVLLIELGLAQQAWILAVGGALGMLALAAGVGMITEYAIQVLFRQPYHATNGHGVLMGLILAMIVPPTIPWWVLFIGVAAAVVIGKQIFGGIGGYPFHPAMIGYLILLLSWGYHLNIVGFNTLSANSPVTIYFLGLGGIMLVALGHARWQIPMGVILGALISWAIFNHVYPASPRVGTIYELFYVSHLVFAAFFISTDPTSSPQTPAAVWIYGLGIGVMYMVIKVYGQWQDPAPFAVLLLNVLAPLLDKLRPRPVQVVIQNG